MAAERGRQREFDDPIPLPSSGQMKTLEDAARFIQKLPKAEQQRAHCSSPSRLSSTALRGAIYSSTHGSPCFERFTTTSQIQQPRRGASNEELKVVR